MSNSSSLPNSRFPIARPVTAPPQRRSGKDEDDAPVESTQDGSPVTTKLLVNDPPSSRKHPPVVVGRSGAASDKGVIVVSQYEYGQCPKSTAKCVVPVKGYNGPVCAADISRRVHLVDYLPYDQIDAMNSGVTDLRELAFQEDWAWMPCPWKLFKPTQIHCVTVYQTLKFNSKTGSLSGLCNLKRHLDTLKVPFDKFNKAIVPRCITVTVKDASPSFPKAGLSFKLFSETVLEPHVEATFNRKQPRATKKERARWHNCLASFDLDGSGTPVALGAVATREDYTDKLLFHSPAHFSDACMSRWLTFQPASLWHSKGVNNKMQFYKKGPVGALDTKSSEFGKLGEPFELMTKKITLSIFDSCRELLFLWNEVKEDVLHWIDVYLDISEEGYTQFLTGYPETSGELSLIIPLDPFLYAVAKRSLRYGVKEAVMSLEEDIEVSAQLAFPSQSVEPQLPTSVVVALNIEFDTFEVEYDFGDKQSRAFASLEKIVKEYDKLVADFDEKKPAGEAKGRADALVAMHSHARQDRLDGPPL